MTTVLIENDRAVIDIRLDKRTAMILPQLEGQKKWLQSGKLSFVPSAYNLKVFATSVPGLLIEDKRVDPAAPVSVFDEGFQPRQIKFKTQPREHQKRAHAAIKDSRVAMLKMCPGSGKTKVAYDKAAYLWSQGKINAMLIVTRKGVHRQWIEEQLPTHLSDQVEVFTHWWSKKQPPEALFKQGDALCIFSINITALTTKTGFEAALAFLQAHPRKTLMVVDESHDIKNATSQRTKACMTLGKLAAYRMTMTGTTISKDLTDEWAQYNFLDPNIIGHRYMTSFRNAFCIMGGFEMREVIGTKNLETYKAMVAPYTFVTVKSELDLPPQIWDKFHFEMTSEQKTHYVNLKKTFLTVLDNGELVSVANAAVLVTRLQQITCGRLTDDNGHMIRMGANPRMEALLDVLDDREGKVVIWARFQEDIRDIAKELGDDCVTYYGETSTADREKAKKAFMDPTGGPKYFVSTPAAGGTGLDGLQEVCYTAVYYSNSYNAIDRWQSEDRIHRIGTKESARYTDLVCKGSMDMKILANLRSKKSLSDLVIGDLRSLFDED